MKLEIQVKDSRTDVMVDEVRIEIMNVRKFRNSFDELLKSKPSEVYLHMDKVRYLDSSALGALVAISKKVKDYGGKFVLKAMSESLKESFKISRIDEYFNLEDK